MAQQTEMIREVVGVFYNQEQMQSAIDELEMSQFGRHEISVLADKYTMEHEMGTSYIEAHQLVDNPFVPRGVHVAPEEQSLAEASLVGGGLLLGAAIAFHGLNPDPLNPAMLLGILLGGSAIGAVAGYYLARFLHKERHERMHEQIAKGGLPLWVRTQTLQKERSASSILMRNGAHDVHSHDMPPIITNNTSRFRMS